MAPSSGGHLDDSEPAPAPQLDAQFVQIYRELKRLAHRLRGSRPGETLNTTALVHEAYLKLARSGSLTLKSRAHFFAVAARAMRQILVDAARGRMTKKRGGRFPLVTLDDSIRAEPVSPSQLVALDQALVRLESQDPRMALVVEHRLFAGLSAEETAELLGVSRPTVDREWRAARAWLTVELAESRP
jgi:RNA polymerase sigma factor (TIGR02999 family)